MSRQVTRRELFKTHFPAYPGFVTSKIGNVSAHSRFKGFTTRAQRRNIARAFAAGEWRKRHVVDQVAKECV